MARAKKEKATEESVSATSDLLKVRLKCVYGDNQPNDIITMSKDDYATLHNLGFAKKV